MAFIDMLIPFVIMFVFLLGFWLSMHQVFIPILNGLQLNSRRKQKEKKNSVFVQEIAQLLEVAINKGSLTAAYTFLFVAAILWLLILLLLLQIYPILFALIGSLCVPIFALVFLNIKIYINRVKISYEGLVFVTEFTNNYRIYHKDLIIAMEQTVKSLGDKSPYTKRMLQQLIYRIRNASTISEYDSSLDQMIFTYGTSWSKQLASIFKIALVKSEDITSGLIDIQEDLTELAKLNEKKKQINIQSGFMIKGLVPLIILAGLYFIFGYSDFTLEKFYEYQFVSPIGIKLFIPTAFLTVLSWIAYIYFMKSKNDFY